MNPEKHIDDYMSGALKGDALFAFEQALKSDVDLQNLVRDYNGVTELSEGILEMELLGEIEFIELEENKTNGEDSKPQLSSLRWLYLGIAALCLAVAIYFFMSKDQTPAEEKEIFEKEVLMAYYERPSFEGNKKSVDINQLKNLDQFDQAKYLFELNEFDQSENKLNALLGATSNVDTLSQVNFWLGNIALLKKDYAKAHQAFGKSRVEQAKCYLGLVKTLVEEDRKWVEASCE